MIQIYLFVIGKCTSGHVMAQKNYYSTMLSRLSIHIIGRKNTCTVWCKESKILEDLQNEERSMRMQNDYVMYSYVAAINNMIN